MRIRFGRYTLDLETRQLTRDAREIHLSPKAFALLAALVTERPKVLSKAHLQHVLWPRTYVVEANLSNLVAEIRAALDDTPGAPRFIRTGHGFGYAFCGDATTQPQTADLTVSQPSCWLAWGRRRFPLSVGEHLIGRGPDVAVRLDHSTVSRRHARIVVTADGMALEDIASKNGTFCRNERVTSPVPLADGDAIRIGSVVATFHVRGADGSTETQALEATK